MSSSVFRFTLQKKYVLIFSLIFLSILSYITIQLFNSEKEDLLKLSHQKFSAIFQGVNVIGEEAMSVGDKDKIALKTILQELFKSKVEGLERIYFVDKSKTLFVSVDKDHSDLSDTKLDDDTWSGLENAETVDKQMAQEKNIIHLINKINYKIADREIFLGYSVLTYNIDNINNLIQAKRESTLAIGAIGFAFSIIIIVLVTSILIKRIKALNIATNSVKEGNFVHIDVHGHDELSDLGDSFNSMSQSVKERLLMGKYVSQSTIDSFSDVDVSTHSLGGKIENVCVFFSDIRGFTAFSEKNTPENVVFYLNRLLDLQVEIINAHHGDIDKFVGDEIMAVFRGDDKENNAIAAAIEIQKAIVQLYNLEDVFRALRIGIGINTGDVVSGNIGSKNRMDFTLIGDHVNTGARICGAAAGDEIVVSQPVIDNLKENNFEFTEPFHLELKNKKNVINFYRVVYA